jgi:tetratricopeptide (TPR) repeat protein/predicted aspartyl protease
VNKDVVFIAVLTLVAACLPSLRAFAGACQLGRLAEFPITMTNLRPLVTAQVNGVDVQLLIDSGAFYSMLSAASAAQLKLATVPAPFGFYVSGFGGGTASASITKVKDFTLAGIPLHNIQFLVGGSEVGTGSIGVLGQNVLHIADVDYDLSQGVVRLIRPHDCGKTPLAYWTSGSSTPYSVIDLESPILNQAFATSVAFVNGVKIHVLFDSGAGVSTLSLQAAARVGIKPDSPGVVYAGTSHGIGNNMISSYIAPFSSFKIGDEEIRNTRLRIADIDVPNIDMLIGPDFFLSHRIYVANSQHKLYFTYNGGPVFNLFVAKNAGAAPSSTPAEGPAPGSATEPGATAASAPPSPPALAPPADSASEAAKPAGANASDAADFSRRGAALASRREFDKALPDLNRACELAPDHAEYFYQRGMVHWSLTQADAALADFGQAIKLKPDYIDALVSRAEVLLQRHDKVHAITDLDAASAAAPAQADVRYAIAFDYQAADLPAPAIAQLDLWIGSHADDARLPNALNSRCGARAAAGVDLALALKDCNAALKRADKSSPFYARVANSRAIVFLRMGEYDKSIADFDASLKISPKNASSWYGRGIDKLRKQRTADGEADIAQATALLPTIADEFKRRGIVP